MVSDTSQVADSDDGPVQITTTKVTPRNVTELVAGYLRAVERFRAQDQSSTGRDDDELHAQSLAKAALFEALNWTDVIDEYLARGPRGTRGTPRDPDWADKLARDDGDLVRGFRGVRNVVHHEWIDAVATRTQTRRANASSTTPDEWLWSGLPGRKPPKSPRARGDAAAYGRRLSGRNVLTTLDDMARVLWTKRGWRIQKTDAAQPGHNVGSAITFDPDIPG